MKKKAVSVVTEEKVPEGTDEVIRLIDLIIPYDYYQTRVCKYKIRKVINYYNEHGTFDKPISVIAEIINNNKLKGAIPTRLHLVDEYSRYIAAKYYLGLKAVPIKYIDIT